MTKIIQTVLIFGGTSTIARSASEHFARLGYGLVLLGRDLDKLGTNAQDLRVRYGVPVDTAYFDATKTQLHGSLVADLAQKHQGPLGVLVAFGYLGDQLKAEYEFEEAQQIIQINFTGIVSLLTHISTLLQERGGFIISLASVAGDRGRQSNYVYGSAKAGLEAFLSGLRNRLHPQGVRVITIKPGFVDTPMTFAKEGLFLLASPDAVGKAIVASLDGQRDVIYAPWFWSPIMTVIKTIPENIFKRLSL
jgi:decaprenylphospho-beta-D-erythro-pentofuranosid-2-ulose 2-reductase